MTIPMAIAMKAKLDQAVAQIDEEKVFCAEQRSITQQACAKKQQVLKEEAAAREALLRAALVKEQEFSQAQAKAAGEQEMQRYLWAAGGIGAGLVVGVVIGAGGLLYLQR
jgi:hypothetical protein